jgi:hypothetical protein
MSDLRVKTEHFELWNSAENYLAGESEKIKAKKDKTQEEVDLL